MYQKIDHKRLQLDFPLENLPLDTLNVSDIVLTLLFCGIGIYDPDDNNLNPAYTDLILKLASDGYLAFVISNEHIFFGANLPFWSIIVHDDVVANHSMYTIFQLFGRAGRANVSWKAVIYVEKDTYRRIYDFIRKPIDPNEISVEGRNMNNMFKFIQENNNDVAYPILEGSVTIRHDQTFTDVTTIPISELINKKK